MPDRGAIAPTHPSGVSRLLQPAGLLHFRHSYPDNQPTIPGFLQSPVEVEALAFVEGVPLHSHRMLEFEAPGDSAARAVYVLFRDLDGPLGVDGVKDHAHRVVLGARQNPLRILIIMAVQRKAGQG